MKYSNAVVVGIVLSFTAGCSVLPIGAPSRTNQVQKDSAKKEPIKSLADLFFKKGKKDVKATTAVAGAQTAPDSQGLQIRKSERGNMASYVVRGQQYHTLDSSAGYSARGVASWYGPNFHGRTASSGEVYDMYRLTAAHKTLPLPTYARVTHVENGKSVIVKINDRGPFSGDRIIDLSFAAALRLGMINDGTAAVEIQALSPEELLVLSGPKNSLDIDFVYADGDERKTDQPLAEPGIAEPGIAEPGSAETVVADSGAAAPGVANPGVAKNGQLPVTVPAVSTPTVSAYESPDEPYGTAIEGEGIAINTDGALESNPVADSQTQGTAILPAETLPSSVNRVESVSRGGSAKSVASAVPADEVGSELQAGVPVEIDPNLVAAAEPVASGLPRTVDRAVDSNVDESLPSLVGEANVQGVPLAIPAAVQAVTLPSDKHRSGYYIQAGVFAKAELAERVAVDVVLAAPGEEVHVKPLKDSHMYRVTLGPITSVDHAGKIAEKLDAAGVDNFTVNVK